MEIKSTRMLTQLSVPEGTKVVKNSDGTGASITNNECISDFTIFYRSIEMKYPHLIYAEDKEYPGEIAVHASLVPTFEPPAPQEEFEILEEDEPEQTVLSDGKDFVFFFIIDRSGSMGGGRI